jgi:ATP-dependent RNA helicase RhlE
MNMTPSHASFSGLGIDLSMLGLIDRLGFRVPTPIQHKAIPLAIQGTDIIGIAQTGTGKTLAFGIPLVQRLAAQPGRALVLVPTRELAAQVNEALTPLARACNIRTAVLIGGASLYGQMQELRRHPRILIATPGRLNDHLDRRHLRLDDVGILILDEADRMLDMGFLPQIDRILKRVPRERQTMLFSATLPPAILSIASAHMRLPVRTEIAPSGTAAERVSQELFVVPHDMKRQILEALLNEYDGPVLLFVRTRRAAARVARQLAKSGHAAAEIHADRTPSQRTRALQGFKSGAHRILVATDIAARGIDVTGIELVINYDLPDEPENYVHRIGRTGRAGTAGHAITLATPDQAAEVRRIERIIRASIPQSEHPSVPARRLQESPVRPSGSSRGARGPRRFGRRRFR